MKHLKTATLLIALSPAAQALDLGHDFKLSGFGTLGSASSGNEGADFRSDYFYQHSNGAGRSTGTSFTVDSKFALQLDWQTTERLSFTAQGITQHGGDNTWNPELRLAFAKYKLLPELNIRAGRIRPATYLMSDYLDVNYANPWVRPPQAFYSISPVRHMQGVDLLWRPTTGPVTWLVQPFYGNSKFNLAGLQTVVNTDDIFGLNLSASLGDFTLRAGYTEATMTAQDVTFEEARTPLQTLCLIDPVACSQLAELDINKKRGSFSSVGASWDNGDYFLTGEYGVRSTASVISDVSSWYISGGTRLGKFTPYATYSSYQNNSSPHFTGGSGDLGLFDPRLAGISTNYVVSQALVASNQWNENSISLGLRYDVISNVALKFQWDRLFTHPDKYEAGTGDGLFRNATESFQNRSNVFDVYSVNVDFVF
jgi:hypothetical protein